jgi:hypothetical protein
MTTRIADGDVVQVADRVVVLHVIWEASTRCGGSEIRGHCPGYLVATVDQRYRRPPVERTAGMADSERPHLTHMDLQFLWYLEKRVLVVELRDLHTRRVASSTVATVPSEDNRELIIEGGVTSTEAHDHQGCLWPGQHTG